MKVAETILSQLGGNRFLTMTGASHLMADNNSLRMQLPRNASKANRLKITLTPMDTYHVVFTKYTAGRLNYKTFEFSDDKVEIVYESDDVYCDQLQELFTRVTGMYTHL